jgi:hypothetical protein
MNRPAKRKSVGKPTLYRPEYCQRAIEILAEMKSLQDVADEFSVNYATVFDWAVRIPEFKAAVAEGRRKGKNALMQKGLERTFSSQPFRENTFKFLMAVMYGVRDKQEIVATTTNTNANINVEVNDESTVNRIFEAINAQTAFITQ